MRALAAAAGLVAVVLSGPAHAVELRAPIAKQLFTCAQGVTRISTAQPAPCCEGQLRCAQFLSTQGVLKPQRDPRT